MTIDWVLVAQIAAAVLGALGIGQIITAVSRRRITHADAVARINTTTLEWAEQLKADAADARVAAREARREASEVRTEVTDARREANATLRLVRECRAEVAVMAEYMRRVVGAIRDPAMTIDRLRDIVVESPPPTPTTDKNGP